MTDTPDAHEPRRDHPPSPGDPAGGHPTIATVVEALPNELFRLRLEDGKECMAHVGGKLRMGFTRLVPGTKVSIELSPFDPTKARIVARVEIRDR